MLLHPSIWIFDIIYVVFLLICNKKRKRWLPSKIGKGICHYHGERQVKKRKSAQHHTWKIQTASMQKAKLEATKVAELEPGLTSSGCSSLNLMLKIMLRLKHHSVLVNLQTYSRKRRPLQQTGFNRSRGKEDFQHSAVYSSSLQQFHAGSRQCHRMFGDKC